MLVHWNVHNSLVDQKLEAKSRVGICNPLLSLNIIVRVQPGRHVQRQLGSRDTKLARDAFEIDEVALQATRELGVVFGELELLPAYRVYAHNGCYAWCG